MPPKIKIAKEQIIEKALEIVRESGWEGLNARELALRLHCSTSPIFSCFSGMEELRTALAERITEMYTSFIDKGLKEEKGFKGVGRAYIRFAQEEPQFFRILFMSPRKNKPEFPAADPNAPRVTDAAVAASGLNREQSKKLYFEMWIFVHGIASAIVTKTSWFSDEVIGEILTDAFIGLRNRLKEET